MTDPTVEQIRAYLTATGWVAQGSGTAGTLWVLDRPGHHANGRRLGVPDDADSGYPLDEVVMRIAAAEHRGAADVRDSILDADGLQHARIRSWAISSMCERAAAIVRRQLDEAGDDGFYGFWDWPSVDTMGQQAVALADALEKTSAAIKAAASGPRPAPWHPLWTAMGHAAEAIVRAQPAPPDDRDVLRSRLDAMRAARPASNGDAAMDGGNCGG